MTPEEEPWRPAALERLGAELREVEANEKLASRRRPRWLGATRTRLAALLVALAVIAGVVEAVTPAGALSPINRAPAAAAQARSVRFSSTLEVAVNGHQLQRLTEEGALNFANGDYETALRLGRGRTDRRKVGNVFYALQRGPGDLEGGVWRAFRGAAGSASPPGGGTLIDPQVVFGVLAGARSPVTVVGHEQLGGAPTTHYRLSTTLNAFLAAEASPFRNSRHYQTVSATLDVWLDERGRPTRVEATFSGDSRVGAATMAMVLEFREYGAPVTVHAPSKATLSRRTDRTAIGPLGGDPLEPIEILLFGRPSR